jgi:hypothetical protein
MNKRDSQQRGSKKQTRTPDSHPTSDASPGIENASVLELQRTLGNQAVQRMIANGRIEGRGSRFNGLPPVRGTQIHRSPALQIRHSLKHMPIKKLQRLETWAGDFTTDKYDTVKNKKGDKDIGVDIDLRFKPNKHVDAKKFSFTQMVQSMNEGEPFFIKNSDTDSQIVKDRSIPDDETGEGSHIDRLTSKRSPLYATDNPADEATGGLADAPSTKNSKPGWHYKDDADKTKTIKEDAWMHDKPTLPNRGKNASQLFESTVLVTDGTQIGTYFGSVSWGWETDGTGAFSKKDLSVVSNDVPSGTFAEATKLWNDSKTSDDKETLDLPIVSGKYTNYPRVWLVSEPSKYKSTIMSKLDKNTRVEVTDKGDEQRFNKTIDKYKWWKVTAVSGEAIGQVGWVMQTLLSDTESK